MFVCLFVWFGGGRLTGRRRFRVAHDAQVLALRPEVLAYFGLLPPVQSYREIGCSRGFCNVGSKFRGLWLSFGRAPCLGWQEAAGFESASPIVILGRLPGFISLELQLMVLPSANLDLEPYTISLAARFQRCC